MNEKYYDMSRNKRRFRLIFVVSAFLFGMTIVVLAKNVGDGPLVPLIFVLGWTVLALFLIRYIVVYVRS